MAEKNGYMLRMKQLPKPEYALSKRIIQDYSLTDISELLAVSMILLSEVERYQDGQGRKWIQQVINTYRSTLEKDRVYTEG